eukprot:4259073-Karenia_brevis.AAC.1
MGMRIGEAKNPGPNICHGLDDPKGDLDFGLQDSCDFLMAVDGHTDDECWGVDASSHVPMAESQIEEPSLSSEPLCHGRPLMDAPFDDEQLEVWQRAEAASGVRRRGHEVRAAARRSNVSEARPLPPSADDVWQGNFVPSSRFLGHVAGFYFGTCQDDVGYWRDPPMPVPIIRPAEHLDLDVAAASE